MCHSKSNTTRSLSDKKQRENSSLPGIFVNNNVGAVVLFTHGNLGRRKWRRTLLVDDDDDDDKVLSNDTSFQNKIQIRQTSSFQENWFYLIFNVDSITSRK